MLLVEEVPRRPHLVDRVDLEVVLVEPEPLGPPRAISKISAPSISSVSEETLSPWSDPMPVSLSPGTSIAPIAARPACAPECQSLAFEPVP